MLENRESVYDGGYGRQKEHQRGLVLESQGNTSLLWQERVLVSYVFIFVYSIQYKNLRPCARQEIIYQ